MHSKTNIQKAITIILSALLVFSNSIVCNAQSLRNDEISTYYVNIDRRSAAISISGIKANCKASLQAKSSMALKIKMELQKKKSSGYETVETWSSSKTGVLLIAEESRNINILCDYRLKVSYTAGSEKEVVYKYP